MIIAAAVEIITRNDTVSFLDRSSKFFYNLIGD